MSPLIVVIIRHASTDIINQSITLLKMSLVFISGLSGHVTRLHTPKLETSNDQITRHQFDASADIIHHVLQDLKS